MMKLAMQQIRDEQLEGRLNPPDPLAQAIYSLYMCPAAGSLSRRVVVLTDDRAWWKIDGNRRALSTWLEADAACELIWTVMHAEGARIGEVVYDGQPEPEDYVFHRHNDGYRIAWAQGQAERALARGAA